MIWFSELHESTVVAREVLFDAATKAEQAHHLANDLSHELQPYCELQCSNSIN